ncbi:sensor histidine kinase [Actinacidiphila rubida]|uniref:histidine kinase n=1 Tax=Actinacidiphila rubida TaxID=310780 RepID=A0A1H8N9Z8_9ACTN|nr:HAMP domain-containing sensor histidine kinase [Actinacidiphila rubida]SEO26263.1 two-component system, OmpR family, sensor histidine kinase MprB [Actinacidiphila rubida]
MSLRNRVALAGGAVVLAALVVAALVLYPSLSSSLTAQHDSSLVAAAQQAPDLVAAFKQKAAGTSEARKPDAAKDGRATGDPKANGPTSAPDALSPGSVIPQRPVDVGSTLLQFVAAPVMEGPSAGFADLTATDVQVADGTRAPYFRYTDYGGVRYRVYTAPLVGNDGTLVRAAVPTSVVGATLHRLELLLLAIIAGGCVLAALAARLAAGRVLRPVRRLTDTVEHVTATQDLSARLAADGKDEIARLTRSFAAMMSALDDSVGAQRRLVADASHELRTPLTSLTTNLELLGEGTGVADPQAPLLVREARAQAAELTTLVNDLVDLGRYGSSPNGTHTEDVRLDLLARRVVDRAATRAPHVEFTAALEPCMVHGDPDALERAIGNLVDNAIKWSPDGGPVTVATTPAGEVSVTDRGPGIPAADLPYVFDRFYRSPAARSLPGSGLGLSIVRQIAETHGGGVAAQPLGQGVRLVLTLPPAP